MENPDPSQPDSFMNAIHDVAKTMEIDDWMAIAIPCTSPFARNVKFKFPEGIRTGYCWNTVQISSKWNFTEKFDTQLLQTTIIDKLHLISDAFQI